MMPNCKLQRNLFSGAAIALTFLVVACGSQTSRQVRAQTPYLSNASAAVAEPGRSKRPRELYVPFEDLEDLLSGGPERVYVPREQFEKLLERAEQTVPKEQPFAAAILAANYVGTIHNERGVVQGRLLVECLEPGQQLVPLAFSGIGLRSAVMNGQPASLIETDGRTWLLVEGPGRYQLDVVLTLPVATDAAQQTLVFQVPHSANSSLKLEVPGNVEIKSGASVLERSVHVERNITEFDILLSREPMSIVMSLNNRSTREQSTVMASGVVFAEITTAYERLHATMSLNVLNGARDEFRFAVDEGLEVHAVVGEDLSRWSVENGDTGQILIVKLRSSATNRVVINARLDSRTPLSIGAEPTRWTLPTFVPLEVAGFNCVIGLVTEDRLKTTNIELQNLIPIDVKVLTAALPASMFEAEAGKPAIDAVAAFYATDDSAKLTADVNLPPNKLDVESDIGLIVSDAGLNATVQWSVATDWETVFSIDVLLPTAWNIESLKNQAGQELDYETIVAGGDTTEGTRIRIKLPGGIRPGAATTLLLSAQHTPVAWLGAWQSQTIQIPAFTFADSATSVGIGGETEPGAGAASDTRDSITARSTTQRGTITIAANNDLLLDPGEITNLLVMDGGPTAGDERSRTVAPGTLAYRYESNDVWSATAVVRRKEARLTAVAYSFFRLEPELLAGHYEIAYLVEGARTQQLQFSLPSSTPNEVTIRGVCLPGEQCCVVKETSSSETDDRRVWVVDLADKHIGLVRLAIDFTQPITERLNGLELPTVRAVGVEYQSGIVSVEGHPELDTQVVEHPRLVDIGELVDAQYEVGKRLQGVYGYAGEQDRTTVDIARRPIESLPTTIVQRAELLTMMSAQGTQQTAARYLLKTKAAYLEAHLPPGAVLWSVTLDGAPALPYRSGAADAIENVVMIAVPANSQVDTRDLQVVYETQSAALQFRSPCTVDAPELFERDRDRSQARPIPTADLVWQIQLPGGYKPARVNGQSTARLSLESLWSRLWRLGGGRQSGLVGLFASRKLARIESANYASPRPNSPSSDPFFDGVPFSRKSPGDGMLPPAGDGRDMPRSLGQVADADFAETEVLLPQATTLQSNASQTITAQPQVPAPPSQQAVQPPIPAPPPAPASNPTQVAWAMEGVRSLEIQLDQKDLGERLHISNLGSQPTTELTVIDARRLTWAGLVIALVAFMFGLGCVAWSARLRYVLVWFIAMLVVPIAIDLGAELEAAQDYLFFALVGLLGWYLLRDLGKWCWGRLPQRAHAGTGFSGKGARATAGRAVAIFLMLSVGARSACAQADPFGGPVVSIQEQKSDKISPTIVTDPKQLAAMLRELLDDGTQAIAIPRDAVVVPYNPEKLELVSGEQQILVDYAMYQDLLRRAAQPDAATASRAPSREFALAGVNYELKLDASDAPRLSGTLIFDQFVDRDIMIPLRLSGGVLESAQLDAQPARLHMLSARPVEIHSGTSQPSQIASVQPPPGSAQQSGRIQVAAEVDEAAAVSGEPLIMLNSGRKGRHELKFVVRLKLEKLGGWRSVAAQVPTATASQITLIAERARTDIRLRGVADRSVLETESDNQRLTFALPPQGQLGLQWRDKIQSSDIDQGLTVDSSSLFAVKEDALQLIWQAAFEFRRSRRDAFSLRLPADYLVERVVGGNIRGWTTKATEDGSLLDITLLKAAEQRESLTVFLSKATRFDAAGETSIFVPQVTVPGAMLHRGQLLVRRSEFLELATGTVRGLSRIDRPAGDAWLQETVESGPLPLVDFQAYQFSQPDTELELQARIKQPRLRGQFQSLLKVAQRQTTLETRLLVTCDGRDAHRLQIRLPRNVELERPVLAGDFEWSLYSDPQDADAQLLEIYLADGVIGEFPVILRGRVALAVVDEGNVRQPIPIPKLELLNAEAQSGSMVIQADPAYEASPVNLVGCETVLLDSVSSWLDAQQRKLARFAVRHSDENYSGDVRILERPQVIASSWLSNVKVTDRAIEETILILVKIESAGIRDFTFRLPASLAKARIQAPLLRRKTVTPVDASGDADVVVRLELQDAIMGQMMIVVENDRLLTLGSQEVPIPMIENGDILDRFVTLENSGRDELLSEPQGLRKVDSINFGDDSSLRFFNGTTAEMYAVVDGGLPTQLTFQTNRREAVATVGARIGLAQTLLIVDEFGGYRAAQEYRVENRTEPYLEINLPEAAQLWTVTVAGEPVKPAMVVGGPSSNVRIPLIRTAEGDLDYPVIVKYGGNLKPLGRFRTSDFPFIETVNIGVELSQVRLRLPEQQRWFNFEGSVGRVQSDSELQAGWLAFRTRQLSDLTDLLGSSQKLYSKARATNNLKSLSSSLASANQRLNEGKADSLALQQQLQRNEFALKEAQQQINDFEETVRVDDEIALGNRLQVSEWYRNQENPRAYNVVNEAGSNFDSIEASQAKSAEAQSAQVQGFDSAWLSEKSLDAYASKDNPGFAQDKAFGDEAKAQANKTDDSSGDKKSSAESNNAPPMPVSGPTQTAMSMQVTAADQENLQEEAKRRAAGDYRQQVERYNLRLQGQAMQSPSGMQADFFGSSIGADDNNLPTQSGADARFAAPAHTRNSEIDIVTPAEDPFGTMGGIMGGTRELMPGMDGMGGMPGQAASGQTMLETTGNWEPSMGGYGGDLPTLPAAQEPSSNGAQSSQVAASYGLQGANATGSINFNGRTDYGTSNGLSELARGRQTDPFDASFALLPQNAQSMQATMQASGQMGGRGTNTAFLASLDVDLPIRGREYLFTTPGGKVTLQAQSISEETLDRLQLAGAIAAFGIGLMVIFRVLRPIVASRSGRWCVALTLGILGVASLVAGVVPIYGSACLVIAVAILCSPAPRGLPK